MYRTGTCAEYCIDNNFSHYVFTLFAASKDAINFPNSSFDSSMFSCFCSPFSVMEKSRETTGFWIDPNLSLDITSYGCMCVCVSEYSVQNI